MFTDMDMDDPPADFRDSFTQDSPSLQEVRQALLGDEGTAKSSSRWRTWKCCACCTCAVIVFPRILTDIFLAINLRRLSLFREGCELTTDLMRQD